MSQPQTYLLPVVAIHVVIGLTISPQPQVKRFLLKYVPWLTVHIVVEFRDPLLTEMSSQPTYTTVPLCSLFEKLNCQFQCN